MAITVSAAAESNQLTTVLTVRTELGLSVDATQDAIIDSMINEASAAIEIFCNRKFAQRTITETLTSLSDTRLDLKFFPIVTLTSVTYDGTLVASTEYSTPEPEQGWIFNTNYWKNTKGQYLYSIVYSHGYILPSFTSGTRDLPYDIERACILMVKNIFLSREREQGLISEEIPDVHKVSFERSDKGTGSFINSQVSSLLSPYKKFKA